MRQISVNLVLLLGKTSVRTVGVPSASMPRLPVGFDDRHVTAEPARVMAAAGEGPLRGDVVSAGDGARLAGTRTPGENAARAAENLLRHFRREIRRGHRAAAILIEAPGRAGIDLGDRLDDRHILGRQQFGAAQRTRQQQPEKALLDKPVDDRCGKFAPLVDRSAAEAFSASAGARARRQCNPPPSSRARPPDFWEKLPPFPAPFSGRLPAGRDGHSTGEPRGLSRRRDGVKQPRPPGRGRSASRRAVRVKGSLPPCPARSRVRSANRHRSSRRR